MVVETVIRLFVLCMTVVACADLPKDKDGNDIHPPYVPHPHMH